jgi:hypothetical protein
LRGQRRWGIGDGGGSGGCDLGIWRRREARARWDTKTKGFGEGLVGAGSLPATVRCDGGSGFFLVRHVSFFVGFFLNFETLLHFFRKFAIMKG